MNYEDLLNKINSYLQLEDVETTNDIISAYNLENMLEEEFLGVRNVVKGDVYVDRINANRRSKIFTIKEKIQARLKKESLVVYIDKKCEEIVPSTDDDKAHITIWFDDRKSITIYRDFNSTDIYSKWEEIPDFLDINFDILNECFNLIEEFTKKTGINMCNVLGNRHKSVHEFSDEFLRIKLVIDEYAKVKLTVSIEKNKDKNGIISRKYYDKPCLSEYLNDNRDALLRKIPIDINCLEDFMKEIIRNNIKKGKILKINQ